MFNREEQRELNIYRSQLRYLDKHSHGPASRPSVQALVISLNKAFSASLTHEERIAIWLGLCEYNPTYFDTTNLFTRGAACLTIQWLHFELDDQEHSESIVNLPVREVVVTILKKVAMEALGYIPFQEEVEEEVMIA